MASYFLSSVSDSLDNERKFIYDLLSNEGFDVFAFPEDINTKDKFEDINYSIKDSKYINTYNQKICLEGVIQSDVYIGIFKKNYGSSFENHQANLSLTELELYTAIRYNKRIIIYIATYDRKSDENQLQKVKFKNLLNIIGSIPTTGQIIRYCSSQSDLEEKAKMDLAKQRLFKPFTQSSYKKFISNLVQQRVELLDDATIKLTGHNYQSTNLDFAKFPNYIQQLQENINFHEKLNLSGNLIFFLQNFDDFDKLNYPHYWEQLLEHYKISSGWIGLHGPIPLGRLSADNLIVELKLRIATDNEIKDVWSAIEKGIYSKKPGITKEWGEFYRTYESLASEFYSIAKLCLDKTAKIELLNKAENYLSIAEHSYTINSIDNGEYGFYSQKANILFEQGHVGKAIKYFKLCVDKREEKFGNTSAEYGESLSYYGYAQIFQGKREGFKIMAQGMEILESHDTRLVYLQRIQGKYTRQLLLKGSVIQKLQAPYYLYKAYKTRKRLGFDLKSLFYLINNEISDNQQT